MKYYVVKSSVTRTVNRSRTMLGESAEAVETKARAELESRFPDADAIELSVEVHTIGEE